MAEMMVRFDVEAYRIDPWHDNHVFSDEEYEDNKRVWRGHAEEFLRAAKKRGAAIYLEVFVSERGNEEASEEYCATAYMTTAGFHRTLLDNIDTSFGRVLRRGEAVKASITDEAVRTIDFQTLRTDPVLHYLGAIFIDGEYEGEDPDAEEWEG